MIFRLSLLVRRSPGFRLRLPVGRLSFGGRNDNFEFPMLDNPQSDEQNSGLEPQQPRNLLGKNQKWAAAGLAVFAFLIVALWFVQLKNNIYAPLNSNSAGLTDQTQIDNQTAGDLALKNKDTDGDGLSDYDELNVYKTSPYLADSDSDGIKDGEEIKNGTDPNCPAGRTCSTSTTLGAGAADNTAAQPAAGSDTLNNILNQYNAANSVTPPSASAGSAAAGTTGSLTAEQKQALQGMDAASLRQLLIQNGMAQTDLDQISDADLMQSYSETLNSP